MGKKNFSGDGEKGRMEGTQQWDNKKPIWGKTPQLETTPRSSLSCSVRLGAGGMVVEHCPMGGRGDFNV